MKRFLQVAISLFLLAGLIYTVATNRWDDFQDVVIDFVQASFVAVTKGKIGELPDIAGKFGRSLSRELIWPAEKGYALEVYVKDNRPLGLPKGSVYINGNFQGNIAPGEVVLFPQKGLRRVPFGRRWGGWDGNMSWVLVIVPGERGFIYGKADMLYDNDNVGWVLIGEALIGDSLIIDKKDWQRSAKRWRWYEDPIIDRDSNPEEEKLHVLAYPSLLSAEDKARMDALIREAEELHAADEAAAQAAENAVRIGKSPNGSVAVGVIKNDLLEGLALLILPDGTLYQGNFRHNALDGQGISYYSDGSIYDGMWSGSKWSGYGELRSPTVTYLGSFVAGHCDGQGTLHSVDGTTYRGEFKDDEASGQGTLICVNGGIYKGAFLHNKPSGRGKFKDPNGNITEGIFENGLPNGPARVFLKTGVVITGLFTNGVLNGKASFVYRDGSAIVGNFSNGVPTAEHVLMIGKFAAPPQDYDSLKQEYTYEINGREYYTKWK